MRWKAPYWPALPTVTSVSPCWITSFGCAPETGSGWRRVGVIGVSLFCGWAPLAAKPVQLTLPVVVEEERDPPAGVQAEAVLHADTGQPGFSKIDRHLPSLGEFSAPPSDASLLLARDHAAPLAGA